MSPRHSNEHLDMGQEDRTSSQPPRMPPLPSWWSVLVVLLVIAFVVAAVAL